MTAAPPGASLRATLVDDRAALEPWQAAWDALAREAGRPFCASAWQLGWWDCARPRDARLAVVLVTDGGGELIGVAPGFTDRGPARAVRWRPLAGDICQQVDPFAAAGREAQVAAAIAGALRARSPRPQILQFERTLLDSPWPRLLAGAWTRRGPRPVRLQTHVIAAPVIDLPEGFDAWFASKTSHFRQRLRRAQRAAEKDGAALRVADGSTAAADLDAFLRLHTARWADRGGTRAVPPAVEALLRHAGRDLVEQGALRVLSLELDGAVIASSLVFHAGREASYWLNGFDGAYARYDPSKLSILQVVQDAAAAGVTRLDLGEGSFPHKRRFAEREQTLAHISVAPWSARMPQTVAGLAPRAARGLASRHLSPRVKARLRGLGRMRAR